MKRTRYQKRLRIIIKSQGFILSLFLYGITFLVLLPIVCHSMNHSVYFFTWRDQKDIINQLKLENHQRLHYAEQFLEQLNATRQRREKEQNILSQRGSDVVISIITQSRMRKFHGVQEPYYLTQTAMKFVELSQKLGRDFSAKIFVCNVDRDPEHYQEVLKLNKVVEVVNQYSQLSLSFSHPKEQEKQDYVFCLNKSLEYKADYVFLVEDDALPDDDALNVLRYILRRAPPAEFSTDRIPLRPDKTAFIKFYHPDRLLQFTSAGMERIPELLSLAAVLSTMLTVLCVLYLSPRHFDIRRTYGLWGYWFVYFLLVSLLVGRTNLLKMRRFLSPHLYSLTATPSCCTQAVLYPRHSATSLVNFMKNRTCNNNYAKDHILDEFPERLHMKAFLVQPNTFQHIGLYSAVRGKMVNPLLL